MRLFFSKAFPSSVNKGCQPERLSKLNVFLIEMIGSVIAVQKLVTYTQLAWRVEKIEEGQGYQTETLQNKTLNS